MNVRVTDQTATSTVIDRIIGLQNKIISKYKGFQAPLYERRVLLALADALIVVLAVFVATQIWYKTANSGLDFATFVRERWYWFPILLSGWWILAWLNDLYYVPASFDKVTNAMRVAIVGVINLAIYLVAFFLIPNQLPRVFFLYFLVIVWSAITLWRWAYTVLFFPPQYRVLIIGRGAEGESIARVLKQASKLNYQVLGYVDDNLAARQTASDGLPVLGRTADLPELVQQLQVHAVVLAMKRKVRRALFERLVECQARGVRVSLMSDLYAQLCRKIPIEHIDPAWAIHVMHDRPLFSPLQLGLKRLMDLGLGMIGLLILGSILPMVALAIRLDSSGPIFYRQTRCGQAGTTFSIIKFRTMSNDAEKDGRARWATQGDARVTRVGRLLRKTRLDELPQVLNVLHGDMSIVGPRPERPELIVELQQVIPYYNTRMMVKPGLTGWAQVHYNYGNTVTDALIKLQYDFYYLRYWTLWLDLYTVFRTFGVVFGLKGI